MINLSLLLAASGLFPMYLLMFIQLQAVAGLAADGRQIVARAKSEATNYERFVLFFIICEYVNISLSQVPFYMCASLISPLIYSFFCECVRACVFCWFDSHYWPSFLIA